MNRVKDIVKKNKENILSLITLAFILYMIVTMVRATSYSVLAADDFSHAVGVGAFHVSFPEYLKASFDYSKSNYMNWQGTYFSMFIQALLSPLNNYGFSQLRCVMVANSLLFFSSLVFFSWVVLNEILKEKTLAKLLIIAILVFSFCGFHSYPEIFFWFSGATSYGFPFSFLLFALALFVKASSKKSILNIVFSILLGIIAMGGSLAISGVGCFIALIFCFYLFLSRNTFPKRNALILLTWIVAAGINAIAPGNFARHSVIDQSGIHPRTALYSAINMANMRWDYFFDSTAFVFLLVIVLLIGFLFGTKFENDKSDSKAKLIVSFLGLFTPWVAAFPVALGYSSDFMPDRCAFVIDTTIILTSVNLVYLLGKEVLGSIEVNQRKIMTIFISIAAALVFMLDGFSLSSVKIFQISKKLSANIYQDHFYACEEFVDSLENLNEGEDIRISSSDFPEGLDDTYNFFLSEDPTNWVNSSVSQYYGLRSIAIYYEEE